MSTKNEREPVDTEMLGKATTGSWKASAALGPTSPGRSVAKQRRVSSFGFDAKLNTDS